eukprot:4541629-Pleurochrysis_carterae.AAC.1
MRFALGNASGASWLADSRAQWDPAKRTPGRAVRASHTCEPAVNGIGNVGHDQACRLRRFLATLAHNHIRRAANS